MAVDVTNPREPARPRELFEAPATFEHSAFLTDATGERFLVPVPIDVGQPAEIHVVVNWLGALTRVASKKD
jgi:hypothetical protein